MAKQKRTNTSQPKFRKALSQTKPDVSSHYQSGLNALTTNQRGKVVQGSHSITGSVNVEEALEPLRHDAERYPKCCDFLIGSKKSNTERVSFVEIHPATDGEVNSVVAKFDFVKLWTQDGGSALRIVDDQPRYFWIASGKNDISPNGKRKLDAKGIRCVGGTLEFDKHVR
ncbi:MAG: hypothetical protein ACRC46_03095 [Thermoguttaceae bacterium]